MSTVIYNQNCIDSILTAALLQTMGWTAFSSREVFDVTKGEFAWVGVVPTKYHADKFETAGNNHCCFVHRWKSPDHANLIPKGIYFKEQLPEELNTIEEVGDYTTINGRPTLLSLVCRVYGIKVPEIHALTYLIAEFYNPRTSYELLAMTVLNVKEALRCLKLREAYTPILFGARGQIDKNLEEALKTYSEMKKNADRILSFGARYTDTRVTIHGRDETRRVVTTYESENFWFLLRRVGPKDIFVNIDVAATGTLISTNEIVVADYGVKSPMYVMI